MKYKRLGQTDLNVSVIGFGASPLGDVYRKTNPTEIAAAVNLAIDEGINFFDVSPYYGHTLAESRLGDALRGNRDKIVLATKCGRYGVDEFDFSAACITAGVEESLNRLHTDRVDLLQAHDVEFAHIDQIINETIPAMRRLQEQGKVRYIGVTGYSLGNLTKIAEQAEIDSFLTYCRYNLLIGDLVEKLMPVAEEHGIGLINASALHMGVLTQNGAPSWHPAPVEVHEIGRKIAELCRARNLDVSEVALNFALQNPDVSSTLVGLSSRHQVFASLRALDACFDPDLSAEIRRLADPIYGYVWPSGLAENLG